MARHASAAQQQSTADRQEMRTVMAFLDRSLALQQSYRLTARINRFGVAVAILQCYYAQFEHGYDPTNDALQAHNEVSRHMLFSILADDVVSRECRGIESFLCQWETYTKCHRSLRIQVTGMALVAQDDYLVSVSTPGKMHLEISDETIAKLYPTLLSQRRHQEEEEEEEEEEEASGLVETAHRLVGKAIVLPFEKIVHFNSQGKIAVLETRVDLRHALLQVVPDPSAATQILQASVITEEGHWRVANAPNGIGLQRNELPKQLL